MLSRIKLFNSNSVNFVARACSTAQKWDLLSAVCVERRPKIVPEMSAIECDFSKQLAELEFERSFKSPHEVQHENDLKQIELLKKGDADMDASLKQTAQDFYDASVEELGKFKFGSKITEAGKKNNLKSTERKLDKHLVLLTEQKIGGKSYFLPPQGLRQDGETLRQTAERVLFNAVGKEVQAQIYSNAPAGFYKYRYPKEVRNERGTVGAKVFIYFVRHKSGDLPEKVNHKWLDRIELNKELPIKYSQSLQQFLIDE